MAGKRRCAVLCNRAGSKSHDAALKFGWPILFCSNNPELRDLDLLVVVVANYGDEELQPDMEQFLLSISKGRCLYALCELGNYFGFEDNSFGCKKEAIRILDSLGWRCVYEISVDSYPELDESRLMPWVEAVKKHDENAIGQSRSRQENPAASA